jgi:purine-cytosine permease-like protein
MPTVRDGWVCLAAPSDYLQIALQCLGAAAAASSPFVPHWKAGYAQHGVAGLLDAMLSPVGKFGKCLMIILSLSVTAANAPTIYSMSLAFQTFIPPLVARPRYVFSVFAVVL